MSVSMKLKVDKGATYALLEDEEVILCESVGFGDDGDEVDTRSETFHDFNVQGLQSMRKTEYKKNEAEGVHTCDLWGE